MFLSKSNSHFLVDTQLPTTSRYPCHKTLSCGGAAKGRGVQSGVYTAALRPCTLDSSKACVGLGPLLVTVSLATPSSDNWVAVQRLRIEDAMSLFVPMFLSSRSCGATIVSSSSKP